MTRKLRMRWHKCQHCEYTEEYCIDVNDPDEFMCPNCNSLDPLEVLNIIQAPLVLHASWPDGHRKKNHEDWQIMRAFRKADHERMKARSNKLLPDKNNLDVKIAEKEMTELKKRFKPRNDT